MILWCLFLSSHLALLFMSQLLTLYNSASKKTVCITATTPTKRQSIHSHVIAPLLKTVLTKFFALNPHNDNSCI